MTFEEAIQNAVKGYFKGKGQDKKAVKERGFKYTKAYFDRFEETEFGSKIDYLEGDKY